jgi:hypothetical protein
VSEGVPDLARLVRAELERPPPEAARLLSQEIRDNVGAAARAVVFYGSCLRKQTEEGVHDFYVLVDDYASALESRNLARAAAALPPTVFYIECRGAARTLRAKYAVLTLRDLARAAAPGGWRTGVWARFCQPVLCAWARDAAAREAVVECCVQSILTAVQTVAPLLTEPAAAEDFWQRVFADTYAREMRTESPESIGSLYRAASARYDRALGGALAELEARGALRVKRDGERFRVDLPESERRRARRSWRWRRPLVKLVYVAQLVKTAFTFGDWLPYALWKVERHSGTRVPYTERQRRHPFIFGWPLLYRVLRRRDLR